MSYFLAKCQEQSSMSKLIAWWELQACGLFNCFEQVFNCIPDKRFNSCYKKEHLKGNRQRLQNVFCVHFTMDPDLPVTSLMQQHYLKKIFEGVWDSNFKRFELAKFLRSSLNSWNQWVNDQPLYQSLFQPLVFI